ncbi:hypothetical protein BYT27DRAFT_7199617 [Phlegmacium glaucopus]|nr:hypothetical protein BYT27DRAFT_7199617 [Phlegmacium glaucopus]
MCSEGSTLIRSMSQNKRLSQSLTGSWREPSCLPITFVNVSDDDAQEWLTTWETVYARDLIDSRVISVDADTSVEEACDVLLSEGLTCLAVKVNSDDPATGHPYHGLFDYADVNAFLTLAATRHTFVADDLRSNSKVNDIVAAAKAGRVPVHLVSNLSEKNIIEILPHNATLVSLLGVFARGLHRTLIQSSDNPREFIGMVSDHRLLKWFALYARETPSFQKYLSNPIQSLSLPSLNLHDAVVSATASKTILDAMKLMSEEGVSSIAVVEDSSGTLLSAVSVTDIGKIVVPSQSNQILTTTLHHFIGHIKDSDGITDGADKYPVYSVFPSSLLSFTMEKILATNAHRVFVTKESGTASPILSPSLHNNLTGIVSIVDILSLFARVAKVPNIDPTQMQRHRRASSASSQSSISDRDFFHRSRSSSRTSIRQSPKTSIASSPPGIPALDSARNCVPAFALDPLGTQRKEKRRSVVNPKKESG